MPRGSNEPCPCGSGKGRARCCGKGASWGNRASFVPSLPADGKKRARAVPAWEADIVAVPQLFGGLGDVRSVVVLVVAGDLVVRADPRFVSAMEARDVARALEEAVSEAARVVGTFPETVLVRHPEVAPALAPLLGRHSCKVRAASPLFGIDNAARSFAGIVTGGRGSWPALHPPETWAAWGLPASVLERFFQGAARFYRAGPWRWFGNASPAVARWEDTERPWAVLVLGSSGQVHGLAVFSELRDCIAHLERAQGEDPFQDLLGWVVHAGFTHREKLRPSTAREISRHRWEVAGVDAYPYLIPILTLGAGLPVALVQRLIRLLDGVVALSETHGEDLCCGAGDVFTWKGDGLTLSFSSLPGWVDDAAG
jgi:hypothetical protein